MENIGTHIKHRRKLMSLTQAQLATRSEISQASISRLENGDNSMALEQFISLLHTLCLNIDDVFPTTLTADITDITNALDDARKLRDTKRIGNILNSHPPRFWRKSPELHIYMIWHEAILSHSRGNSEDAILKIEKITRQYHDVPTCYEIVAQVLNNLGNIHTDINKKLHAYSKAKELYLNSTKSNYHTYIKILVNLGNTYCKKKNYKQSLRHVNTAYEVLRDKNSTYLMTSLTIIECNAHHFLNNYDICMEKMIGSRSFFEHANQLEKWESFKKIFT